MYKYETVVRICLTDAGGVVYFANYFVLAHECYESFLDKDNLIGAVIGRDEYIIPVSHAEADFRMPLKVSEKVFVEMTLKKMSRCSFGLNFVISNESGEVAAEVNTEHAVLNKSTWKPVKIPEVLKAALGNL